MYSKPEVVASRAIHLIQKQQSMATKVLPLYWDIFLPGNWINQKVTPAAYEADE